MISLKVSEIIKLLEADVWYLYITKGDHRQFKHPTKKGKITVRGKHIQIKITMEKTIIQIVWNKNYGAYTDLLPGCVAADETLQGVKEWDSQPWKRTIGSRITLV